MMSQHMYCLFGSFFFKKKKNYTKLYYPTYVLLCFHLRFESLLKSEVTGASPKNSGKLVYYR